jgi:hypothetical protein
MKYIGEDSQTGIVNTILTTEGIIFLQAEKVELVRFYYKMQNPK